MSTATITRPAPPSGTGNGGVPARRAVIRWAWRLFRREWRQQLLVLALIIVAVGATVLGAAVATNTPPAASSGFGTAQDQATYSAPDPHLASQIASLQQRFGTLDVIENQTLAIPGSIESYDLRAQNPNGAFGGPMLQLLSGHYPTTAGQVALTPGLASGLGLRVGDGWHQGGKTRLVTGIVQNPQSLLDEFALVIPGQVTSPSQVTVLFDAGAVQPGSIGPNVQSQKSAAASNPLNPETIVLALATLGMLLIALVAVGGFTVLAQRRMRALGMLEALGATDRHVRLVVRTNGAVVGVVGALAGAVLGLAAWLAYRPSVEASAHHVIGTFQLPWIVIGPAMVLAVLATYFAAARPARAITRLSIVAALSGRPAPPKQVHRSIVPGVVLLVVSALLLWYTGESTNGGGAPELLLGLVALIAAVILLAGPCLAVVARFARHTPIAARLALRDLGRYRARSGSALAAISLGVLIAVLICVLSASRFGNVLDYAGPNMASNQLIVYTPNSGPGGGNGPGGTGAVPSLKSQTATAYAIAAALGSHDVVRARVHERHASACRARPSVQRVGLPGHPAAAGRLRDQGVPGQPRRRHPVHAAWPVRHLGHAAHLRRPQRLQLPQPGQPGDPAGGCPPVRHVGPEHGDHRARGPDARPAGQRLGQRLVHPGPAQLHRGADHQRPDDRGGQ